MNADVQFYLPFPSRVSPFKDEAREHNLSWARHHRLVDNPRDESCYRSWDIADLMARWLPDASLPGLDLAVDALSFAALLDDQFDGPLAEQPAHVSDACATLSMVLESDYATVSGSPMADAFADVWSRQCHGTSNEWRERAAQHWRWFLDAFVEEARIRADRISPTREEYLALRRKSGIVYAMLDLTEAAYGFETSPRVRRIPTVQRMLTLTADIVDTINDVYSLDKEKSRGDVHNLVLVIQNEQSCSRQDALAQAHTLVHRWCIDFQACAAELPTVTHHHLSTHETAQLYRLAAGMRDAMGGFPDWSRLSGRYVQLIPAGEPAYHSDLMSCAHTNASQ